MEITNNNTNYEEDQEVNKEIIKGLIEEEEFLEDIEVEENNKIIQLDNLGEESTIVLDINILEFSYPLDKNPARTYISSLSSNGRQPQESALRVASIFIAGIQPDNFPWHLIRYQHIVALRSRLQERYAPSTANRILVAVRRVCHEAVMLDYMKSDDYIKISSIKPIRGSRLSKGKSLSDEALKNGVCSAREEKTAERDVAIICLLHGAGLRRSELTSLNIEDFDGKSVRVIGKGNKERRIPLAQGAIISINNLISKLGRNTGPLFVRAWKGGNYSEDRISGKAIANIISEKLDAKPHDLRRTYVTNLLESGVDIATAANLVGHGDVNTTKKYDFRGERAMEEAVLKIRDILDQ